MNRTHSQGYEAFCGFRNTKNYGTNWISSGYGWRTIFGSRSFHGGIDIANNYGTTIVASDGGLVTYSGWNSGGYGYLIVITHDTNILISACK